MALQYHIAGYDVDVRNILGRGGYGTVYKAKDKNGIPVAAKEIDKNPDSKAALKELENCTKQKQLNHENVVKILDIHNEDEKWMFIEFCNGGDVSNFARNHFKQFSKGKLLMMRQIASGLNFLHECRIAHRDMKPENVLIQYGADSQHITVKLTDFGLAKFHALDAKTSVMHTNLGTHTYKAPEFWDWKDGNITYRKNIDIYAMGLTFLAILQARKDENLRPKAEGCLPDEKRLDIGCVMHMRLKGRQPELLVVENKAGDSKEIQTAKELVRQATAVNSRDRPTAGHILQQLKTVAKPSVKTRISLRNSFNVKSSPDWYYICASRDGDEVFLCGDLESGGSDVLQRYNKTGQLLNTWQVKCVHSFSKHLLHLSIDNTPYIAVSCRTCWYITLYSMTDSDPITEYCDSGEDHPLPGAMCHGPHNTILVSDLREVLMYDVTSTQFTLKDRIPVDVELADHIHYMETATHGGIIIVCGSVITRFDEHSVISAYSIVSKKLVWMIVDKKIDGKLFKPHGLCSDPDTEALYVGDKWNERLIVIEANTGEVIQSIQLPGVGEIWYIAWCSVQPHLVIHSQKEKDCMQQQITYFNMK